MRDEIRRVALTGPGLTFKVFCNTGHNINHIQEFTRRDGSWSPTRGASKARRERQASKAATRLPVDVDENGDYDFAAFVESMVPGGDRPTTERGRMGRSVAGPDYGAFWGIDSERRTYDLTCKVCKRRRRHTSYQRRAAEFHAILDELSALGMDRATPDFLSRYDAERQRRAEG